MKHSPYLYDELREIAPFLAELEKTNIFSVPEDYFSRLDIAILEMAKTDGTYLLAAKASPVLTVPDGYFDNLAGNILHKIKNAGGDNADDAGDELQYLFPQLYKAKNINIFNVPAGYFDAFSDTVLSLVKSPPKVVVMKKRSMLWNCAAAAILTGVMAISALWITDTSSPQNLELAGIKNIPSTNSRYFDYKNEQQISKGIADLSDTDIIGYLAVTGTHTDDEALVSVLQEKELPAEQDYLTDENTLENFLGSKDYPNNQN